MKEAGIGSMAVEWRPIAGHDGFRLLWARCMFGDLGATATIKDADLTIGVKAAEDGAVARPWDGTLYTMPAVGITRPARFIPPADRRIAITANDWLTFTWTNPDAGKISWGLEWEIELL